MIIEPTLNVNSLRQNPVIKDEAALLRHVFNLIVMIPGTDPLNPNKGCNFNSYYYKLRDDNELRHLEQKIKDQVSDYLGYQGINVTVSAVNENNKHILYCFASMTALSSPMLISSDGTNSRYTQINNFSKDLMNAIK